VCKAESQLHYCTVDLPCSVFIKAPEQNKALMQTVNFTTVLFLHCISDADYNN